MARVAIVIVTHQSADFISSCLDSIGRVSDSETIVIDNASADTTCVRVSDKGVRLIANSHNAGFAAAVNQGVQATSAPLILLLNPDARLETGLESLIGCFDNPKTGGAGGLLLGPDGRPQTGFMARNLPSPAALAFEVLGINHLWPKNPVNWYYRCCGFNLENPAVVGQPAGAFFMFRRSAWQQLGGFDESFWPVWFEDVDFCARLKAGGYIVRYEPGASAMHQGGHSVEAIPAGAKEKYWYGSLLRYAAKHYHPIAFIGICVSVIVGAAGRTIREFPRRGGSQVFAVYGSVIRLALARLFAGKAFNQSA